MKKTVFLTAALLLCTATGFAYENPAAGYSVKDNAPLLKLESQKMYAFTDLPANSIAKLGDAQQGSMHIINYFSADEMSKSLEVNFSTAYFDAEYEKLALMQRSQIDMRTVPTPLLDRDKYGSAEEGRGNLLLQKELIKKELLNAKPRLRIDKIGKYKVITESYTLKQDDSLVSLDTSLLSANDKLYMLSTITTDKAYYAADKEAEANDEKVEKQAPAMPPATAQNEAQNEEKALPKLEQVPWQSLPEELRTSLWQKHVQLLKSFKATPICNCLPVVRYQDQVSRKAVLLPQDWFYGQLNLQEKEGSFCVTMAASLDNMRQIAAEMDYLGILELAAKKEQNPAKVVLEAPSATVLPEAELSAEAQSKVMEESRKALTHFDAMLMSASFAIKDKELNDFILGTTENQLAAQVMLEETLAGLKRSDSEYFRLNDYKYELDFNELREKATINANVTLLQDFVYDNLVTITMKGSSGTALWYLHKPDFEANQELTKSIEQWQF